MGVWLRWLYSAFGWSEAPPPPAEEVQVDYPSHDELKAKLTKLRAETAKLKKTRPSENLGELESRVKEAKASWAAATTQKSRP